MCACDFYGPSAQIEPQKNGHSLKPSDGSLGSIAAGVGPNRNIPFTPAIPREHPATNQAGRIRQSHPILRTASRLWPNDSRYPNQTGSLNIWSFEPDSVEGTRNARNRFSQARPTPDRPPLSRGRTIGHPTLCCRVGQRTSRHRGTPRSTPSSKRHPIRFRPRIGLNSHGLAPIPRTVPPFRIDCHHDCCSTCSRVPACLIIQGPY